MSIVIYSDTPVVVHSATVAININGDNFTNSFEIDVSQYVKNIDYTFLTVGTLNNDGRTIQCSGALTNINQPTAALNPFGTNVPYSIGPSGQFILFEKKIRIVVFDSNFNRVGWYGALSLFPQIYAYKIY